MIYGYARISTQKQSIERQISNILQAEPKAKIYAEAFTGTRMDRPEWLKLMKVVKPGDIIVFDEISRLSRNAAEGVSVYKELYNKGIELKFLKESYCDTSMYRSASNKRLDIAISTGQEAYDRFLKRELENISDLLMDVAEQQIILAFQQAESEVTHNHARTSEGVREAHKRYVKEEAEGLPHLKNDVGRPKGIVVTTKIETAAKEIILKHSRDFGGTLNDADCIKLAGCSRNSFYKYKRELRG